MDNELQAVMAKAQAWLGEKYDAETRAQVKAMMEAEDKTPLIDAFYRDLEFGTGGLRGIMGPGTNRMNKYIVAMATQGYANYLNKATVYETIRNELGKNLGEYDILIPALCTTVFEQ